MSKNTLIVFEGIETSGKSTNLKKTIKYFKKNKIKYITFREPGGTKFSEKLRSLMLNKKSKFIKGVIGKIITSKNIPEIKFYFDDSIEFYDKIDRIFLGLDDK